MLDRSRYQKAADEAKAAEEAAAAAPTEEKAE